MQRGRVQLGRRRGRLRHARARPLRGLQRCSDILTLRSGYSMSDLTSRSAAHSGLPLTSKHRVQCSLISLSASGHHHSWCLCLQCSCLQHGFTHMQTWCGAQQPLCYSAL